MKRTRASIQELVRPHGVQEATLKRNDAARAARQQVVTCVECGATGLFPAPQQGEGLSAFPGTLAQQWQRAHVREMGHKAHSFDTRRAGGAA